MKGVLPELEEIEALILEAKKKDYSVRMKNNIQAYTAERKLLKEASTKLLEMRAMLSEQRKEFESQRVKGKSERSPALEKYWQERKKRKKQ